MDHMIFNTRKRCCIKYHTNILRDLHLAPWPRHRTPAGVVVPRAATGSALVMEGKGGGPDLVAVA